MRKSFHESGIQFAWDATSLAAYEKCPRYYQYAIIEGWRGNDSNVHLRFGGHYATALEHYYKLVAAGADWLEALEEVVLETLLATWDRPEGDEVGAPWQSFDSNKTRETLIRTIVWYVDEFHDEEMKVFLQANGLPGVEYSFSLPVDDGLIFCGHIDRLAEMAGDIYVVDQKTTGSVVTPRWFEQFKPNTQMSMYTFAGKAVYAMPVKGVIIDAAQIAVGFSRFSRAPTMRTEAELDEWYDQSMYWIAAAQRDTLANYFPMNDQSCDKYGGCAFRGVCSRSPSVRLNFLKASFNQETPWDPLERR